MYVPKCNLTQLLEHITSHSSYNIQTKANDEIRAHYWTRPCNNQDTKENTSL